LHHDDLHPCAQPQPLRRAQPRRPAVVGQGWCDGLHRLTGDEHTPCRHAGQNACRERLLGHKSDEDRLHGRQRDTPITPEAGLARPVKGSCRDRDPVPCMHHGSLMHPDPGAPIQRSPVCDKPSRLTELKPFCIGGGARGRGSASRNHLFSGLATKRHLQNVANMCNCKYPFSVKSSWFSLNKISYEYYWQTCGDERR
jgi:hypothetical protein